MKLIVAFTLLVAIGLPLSSEDERTVSKLKLQEIFNDYYEEQVRRVEYGIPMPDAAEWECVREKMKLSANDEKLVSQTSGYYLLRMSKMLCNKDHDERFRKNIDDDIKDEFSAISDNATKISCLQNKIKELNGAKKEEIEQCKDVNDACETIIKRSEKENERFYDMGIGECVNLNFNQFHLKKFEAIIFKFENNEEAYVNASNEVVKDMNILANTVIDCLTNIFNDY